LDDLFEQPGFIKNVIPFAMIAGVDGCKGGWIAAIDGGNDRTEIRLFSTFSEVLTQGFSLIVIDIPIGLLPSGIRQCDSLARRRLGPRHSCVFTAPIRPVLTASDRSEASKIWLGVEGKACTEQLFNILHKIREVDRVMTPALQRRVREGHPEVSFAMMNGGEPLLKGKKFRDGREERIRLLLKYFSNVQTRPDKSSLLKSKSDDILDAYACLWTARRISQGKEESLPEVPQHDERGLKAEIVV
jgi:predicted RNase H-like nuclease